MTSANSSIDSVSLLLGKTEVPIWFGLAVEEMRARTDATVEDVTVAAPSKKSGANVGERFQNAVVSFQDHIILSNLDREIDVRLLPSVSEAAIRRCKTERAGDFGVTLPERTVRRIANGVDIVVHHGVGILKGDILREPDRGVLGYHHGDIREYRGPGYGFWEYMNEEETSGVTLQVLDEHLDSGQIVHIEPVDISDVNELSEIRRRLNAASVPLLALALKKLEDPGFSPEELAESKLGKMYYYSDVTLPVKLRYLLKECSCRVTEQLRGLN